MLEPSNIPPIIDLLFALFLAGMAVVNARRNNIKGTIFAGLFAIGTGIMFYSFIKDYRDNEYNKFQTNCYLDYRNDNPMDPKCFEDEAWKEDFKAL